MGAFNRDAEDGSANESEKDLTTDTPQNEPEFADTVVWEKTAKPTDNVGEASVEINVESLIEEFEAEAADGVDVSGRIRRKLDALAERKVRHEALQDWEDYDLDS